jgi:nitroreductase
MELYEVMRTTFAARHFTDATVDDATIHRILDNARFAASGGNRQGWKVVVARDAALRDALPPLILPTFQRYFAQMMAGESPFNTVVPSRLSAAEIAAVEVSAEQVRWLTHAPVLLFVFVDLAQVAAFDADREPCAVIPGCSIYPFVWNILLAARSEGLGGVSTTFVGAEQDALRDLLGVPDQYAFAAMIPLGEPVKQLTRLKRRPVEDFATLERFDGSPLTG